MQAREYAEKSLHILDTDEMDPEKMLQGDKISIRKVILLIWHSGLFFDIPRIKFFEIDAHN